MAGYYVALLAVVTWVLSLMRSRADYACMVASVNALASVARSQDDQLVSIGRRVRRLAPLESLLYQPRPIAIVPGDHHATVSISEPDTPSPYGQRVPIIPSMR